jgi:hypothetical protein
MGGSSSPTGAESGELSPEEIEKLVDEHLAARDVPFEVVECDPDLADTDAFCPNYGYAPEDAANTIVVVGKSDPPRFVACVLLATTRLDVTTRSERSSGSEKRRSPTGSRRERSPEWRSVALRLSRFRRTCLSGSTVG